MWHIACNNRFIIYDLFGLYMSNKVLLVNEVKEDSTLLCEGVNDSNYALLCEVDSISKVFMDIHEQPVAALYNLKGCISDHEKYFSEKQLRSPMATIVFVKEASKGEIEQAIKSGIHALIVNGLEQSRIPAIIDTAIFRFREQLKKDEELLQTKQSLEDRKVIEKAKGILMDIKGIKEDEAFKSLRKSAMDENKKLIEVCNNVVKMAKYIS